MPCGPCILSPVVEHASIVAGKYYQGIFGFSYFFQGLEYLTYDPVQFMDKIPVRPALTASFELWGRGKGVVDICSCQVEKEGFVLTCRLQPVNSLVF